MDDKEKKQVESQLLVICLAYKKEGAFTINDCGRVIAYLRDSYQITGLNEEESLALATQSGVYGRRDEVAFDSAEKMVQGLMRISSIRAPILRTIAGTFVFN